MLLPRITEYVHELLKKHVKMGDIVVDATMGNGNDTLALAKLVGDSGKVIAYDIQYQALESTFSLLKQNEMEQRAELHLKSHALMDHPSESLSTVVFNLGYLPRSDQSITTLPESTIAAIRSSLENIKVGGIVILVVYWGHANGKMEKESIDVFVEGLDYPRFLVLKYQYVNPKNCPPYVLVIEKRK